MNLYKLRLHHIQIQEHQFNIGKLPKNIIELVNRQKFQINLANKQTFKIAQLSSPMDRTKKKAGTKSCDTVILTSEPYVPLKGLSQEQIIQ